MTSSTTLLETSAGHNWSTQVSLYSPPSPLFGDVSARPFVIWIKGSTNWA